MIVKMDKITLIVSAKDRDAALENLRELGILHVQELPQATSDSATALETEIARLDETTQIISILDKNAGSHADSPENIVQNVLTARREITRLESKFQELTTQFQWYEEWGHIAKSSLEMLEKSGIYVRFYIAPKDALADLPTDKNIQIARQNKQIAHLALFAESADERLDLPEVFLPETDVDSLEKQLRETKTAIAEEQKTLANYAGATEKLADFRQTLARRLEFETVKNSLANADSVAYLQGFCPVSETGNLQKAAESAGWAYLVEQPDASDDVPTLIRIPKWLRIINPVFEFMGTIPGYREFDVSFWFLLFFSLFFAMLIGDAGYGIIFLIGTFFIRRKMPDAPKEPFVLMVVLSSATVIWGAISGTWFGYEAFAKLPVLSSFVVQQLNSYVAENQTFIMYLSFVIGVVHLTIAHLTVALSRLNSPQAIAQLGWIGVLWALFFLAGNLVLGNPLPDFMLMLLTSGAVLVLIFSNFQKNIFKGMMQTLTSLPLDMISAFSDVVSYIRLFAVGLATVIVAQSFNEMAISIGAGTIAGGVLAALVLFAGHALNIILALMAVVVHGIRLNMLEFSGHLGMQWSGKAYRPFGQSQKKQ